MNVKRTKYGQAQDEWVNRYNIAPGSLVRIGRIPTIASSVNRGWVPGDNIYSVRVFNKGDIVRVDGIHGDRGIYVTEVGTTNYEGYFPYFCLRANVSKNCRVVQITDDYSGLVSKKGIRVFGSRISWKLVEELAQLRTFIEETLSEITPPRFTSELEDITFDLPVNGWDYLNNFGLMIANYRSAICPDGIEVGCQFVLWETIEELLSIKQELK